MTEPTKTVSLRGLRVDTSREAKGDWIASPDIPGVEFKVSSLHLPAFQVALQQAEQRLARQAKGGPVSPADRTPEVGKLLHKHILHDWRGFDEPYSPETAYSMMSDYEGRDFIAAVQNCAALISLRDVQYVEDAGPNSSRPSATD